MIRIETAARTACITQDIDRLPMRYQTLVGDMGSVLSGGQKQRILLARAVYAEPVVLFLDEGTSHLDEAVQSDTIAAIRGNRASAIMAAHRHSAITHCKKIITLLDGTVIQKMFQ